MILRYWKAQVAEHGHPKPNRYGVAVTRGRHLLSSLAVEGLVAANFKADGGIRGAEMLTGQLRLRHTAPVMLIEKTIHLIDDGRQHLRILLSLRHLLQMSPAFGLVQCIHGDDPRRYQ